MNFSEIPTPALVVDLPTLERNLDRMVEGAACALRPHVKAHKCRQIAEMQMARGAVGLTAATVAEVEAFCGTGEVLLANEVVEPSKIARLEAHRERVIVAVDSVATVDALPRGMRVVVDVNIGLPRCGIAPDGALGLAEYASASGLDVIGVMGYEGHVMGTADPVERGQAAMQAAKILVDAAAGLREAGFGCGIVSSGGTCTFDSTGSVDGITEIQPGSYALMDSTFAGFGTGFENALTILSTVISAGPDGGVCDVGLKSVAVDHGNPVPVGDAEVFFLSDEHATLFGRLGVGDRVVFHPSHIDPTVNLHDSLWVVEDGRVVERWPVIARGVW